jgi:surfeit locus 1 family protein
MNVPSTQRSPFLTARAFGLGLVALALMAVMVVLGLWQLGVYEDHQHDDAQAKLSRTPVPLEDVLGPDDAFPSDGVARPVRVTGHYLPDETFEVRGSDTWDAPVVQVTPLQVADGSIVLVVRGRGGPDTPPPPSGNVEVDAVLEPSDANGDALGPDRVTNGIRTAALVQDFREDLYTGYLVQTSSTPADQVTPINAPTPDASRWAGIRNLVYAMQWWVFAGFVAFMWWRMVVETPGGVRPDNAQEDGADDSAASSPRSVG